MQVDKECGRQDTIGFRDKSQTWQRILQSRILFQIKGKTVYGL